MNDNCSESKIGQFYNEKSVFITGATGFMGKVLVEKLLRSTNVKKIYVLIRPKKGLEIKYRLQELMSSKLFENLKQTKPGVMSRVEAIPGDITKPGFAISEDDQRKLTEEVSIVFHSAATVRFDEDLTKSVDLNVVAVFTIMDICRKMEKLEALVQISTAYCNTQLKSISEKIYLENGDPEGMIDLCKKSGPEVLNTKEMTAKIIGAKPNTYTFTKALGENALLNCGNSLPIVIIRPSIVVAAWQEPLPGWIDNFNGPTAVIANTGKGVLRSVYCKSEMTADWVPVDVPINLSIAAAWKIATQPTTTIPVYNCTSSTINPLTWGQVVTYLVASLRKYPMENALWYPGLSHWEYAWVNWICQVLVHSIPAYIMDMSAFFTGNKPVMRMVAQKMHKALKVLTFFATNEWKWSNDNVLKLNAELTDVDKKTFNFDLSTLNWADFMDDYVKGTRQYVFKEDPGTMEEARCHSNKMFWVEKCLQIFLFILLARFCVSMFC